MASTPASSPGSVVIDANVLIGICAREKDKFDKARDALNDYARSGWLFYALGVVIGEVLYVLLSLWRRYHEHKPELQAEIQKRWREGDELAAKESESSLNQRLPEIRQGLSLANSGIEA